MRSNANDFTVDQAKNLNLPKIFYFLQEQFYKNTQLIFAQNLSTYYEQRQL